MSTGAPLTFTEADCLPTIPARFQQVVDQLSPDQLAYVSDAETLTYRALNATSQGLAALLATHLGIGTTQAEQQAVALLLPSCAATLVGIMGILRAGHFYLPLDFAVGETTLRQILADCPPAVVVTTAAHHPQLAALLPAGHTPIIVLIETVTLAANALAPALPPDPYRYACLQYTSGSTGRPRGILRTHATLLHSGYLAYHDLGFSPGERVSHLLSYAHSFSTPTIFGGLLNGATLYAPPMAVMTPDALYHWLAAKQITNVSASVGLLRGLAELAATHPPLTALRTIGTGGEVMARATVEQLCRLLPPTCKLVVRLASTEVGTYARFVIEAGQPWPGNQTPAGYAPPGQQVLIVDEAQQPVAAGELGEIAVGSRFLCAGYWQRPDETAAKFLPDPADSTQRIFLTGDMGRMAADGLVEHVGRKDFMVKIRGYRVQLEEVEAALSALAVINAATVTTRATSTGEKQLIAYYTTAAVPLPTADALRHALLTTLPAYMLPARFVRLDALPRTTIGKIDRAALPPPGTARPALGTPFVAPRNEQEQQIANLWAELLDLDAVGIDDDFFELGGDSLLAMRMILLVEQKSGKKVTTGFFHQPTVAALVKALNADQAVAPDEPVPPPLNRPPAHGVALRHPLRSLNQHGLLPGGYTLPYGVGTRLQRLWLKLPPVQQRLSVQMKPFLQWCELVDLPKPIAREIEISLLANSWRGWREQAIRKLPAFHQWVVIRGEEYLRAALAEQRAILFVGVHTAIRASAWQRAVRQQSERDVWTLSYSPQGNADAVTKMLQARAILQQQGFVQITGDGAQGDSGFEFPLAQRAWLFRAGGAELALATDAILLPVFNTIDNQGKITVEFLAPLTASTNSHAAQVEELTRQYAALLDQRWPVLLSNMKWGKLQQILDYAKSRGAG